MINSCDQKFRCVGEALRKAEHTLWIVTLNGTIANHEASGQKQSEVSET